MKTMFSILLPLLLAVSPESVFNPDQKTAPDSILETGNGIHHPESLRSPKEGETELQRFKKIVEVKEGPFRYAAFIPQDESAENQDNWNEQITLEFEMNEFPMEDGLQELHEERAKIRKNRSAHDVGLGFVHRWQEPFGESKTTFKIEDSKNPQGDSKILDFDLVEDTDSSDRFWSISKIIKTPKGAHRITYLRRREQRTPEESKKWRDLVDSFRVDQTFLEDRS